ncbi:hypothetical protein D356_00308 [Enterococcus faecium SD2A-2]|uniref:Toxin-antitoxin system, toxin component, RelE domain protein n=1 Tax=Enterococcus faecium SD2A-2 TaxID=1244154 RepID=A0AB73ACU8_ENTFC|nr:hypothetical protein D356_00308 [Enterococcus faecium SD2A-2]
MVYWFYERKEGKIMQSSAELKRQAKESLKGRWGQAVLLNMICQIKLE